MPKSTSASMAISASNLTFALLAIDLVKAIHVFRKFTDQPLTLRGSDYGHAVLGLNKTLERAELLLQ